MKQSLFQVCLNVEKNQGKNKFAQIGLVKKIIFEFSFWLYCSSWSKKKVFDIFYIKEGKKKVYIEYHSTLTSTPPPPTANWGLGKGGPHIKKWIRYVSPVYIQGTDYLSTGPNIS